MNRTQWFVLWGLIGVLGPLLTWETLNKMKYYKQSVIQAEVNSARIRSAVEHAEACSCPSENRIVQFDLPDSQFEQTIRAMPDGTFRIWYSNDGITWQYGAVMEPEIQVN